MLLDMDSKINYNTVPAKDLTEWQDASKCGIPRKGRLGNFPHRLFSLLESVSTNPDNESTVAWTKDGMAFDVFQPKEFMEQIGSKWFPGQSTYRAFERQLNNWGFRMTTFLPTDESSTGSLFQHFREGPPSGVRRYWHPCFCRYQPHLRRLVQRHQVKSIKRPQAYNYKSSPTRLVASKLSHSPESAPPAGPIVKTTDNVAVVKSRMSISPNIPLLAKEKDRTLAVKVSPTTYFLKGMGHGCTLQNWRPCPFTDRINSTV